MNALAEWGEDLPRLHRHLHRNTRRPRSGPSSTCVGRRHHGRLQRSRATPLPVRSLWPSPPLSRDILTTWLLPSAAAVCSFTPEGKLPRCLRYEVSKRLRFITIIPPYEVHTSDARKVVPQEVPAVHRCLADGRIAGLSARFGDGRSRSVAASNERPPADLTVVRSSPTTTLFAKPA